MDRGGAWVGFVGSHMSAPARAKAKADQDKADGLATRSGRSLVRGELWLPRVALAPQQEQTGRDHDGGPDHERNRRHVAPDGEAQDARPYEGEVVERRHRGRRRKVQRARPPILSHGIGDAVEYDPRRIGRRRRDPAEGKSNAKKPVSSAS